MNDERIIAVTQDCRSHSGNLNGNKEITPWKSWLLYSLSRRERVEFHLSRPRAANILKVGIFDVCVRIPVRICGGGGVCNVCGGVEFTVEIESKIC